MTREIVEGKHLKKKILVNDFPDNVRPTKNKLVEVEIDLSDDILLKLFLESHRRDMKFNEFCNMILLEYVNKKENIENG